MYEADIGFKLPKNSRLFYGKMPPIKRSSSSAVHLLHASERLELFGNIEGLMDLYVLELFMHVLLLRFWDREC
jgi:hypothetical protein